MKPQATLFTKQSKNTDVVLIKSKHYECLKLNISIKMQYTRKSEIVWMCNFLVHEL